MATGGNSGGGSGSGLTEQDKIDMLWHKKFWSDNSLLPATNFKNIYSTLGALDFDQVGAGVARTTIPGGSKVAHTASALNAVFGWDIGSLKSEIFIYCASIRTQQNDHSIMLFCGDTVPASAELANGSYMYGWETSSSSARMYRRAGGAFTSIGQNTAVSQNIASAEGMGRGLAFYYNDTTNTLDGWLIDAMGAPFKVLTVTDATHTTMRYVGFRVGTTAGVTREAYLMGPIQVYHS